MKIYRVEILQRHQMNFAYEFPMTGCWVNPSENPIVVYDTLVTIGAVRPA